MPAPILPGRGLPSGYLAAEPNRLRQLIDAARAAGSFSGTSERTSLRVGPDGVAVVVLDGLMTKGGSWFGASTAAVRAQIRDAAARDDVRAIVLKVSSPGGYVDGTADLAADVAAAAARKPLEAYVEDVCASAAYWVACQARKVWSNPTALVGSIGAFQVVWDESEAFRQMGVRVHVLSTGPLKGAGEPGTEVTDEQLAAEQTLVDDLCGHFFAAVRTGRRLTPRQLDAVTTGEVWIASKAKGLGLIDGIKTLDDVVTDLADSPEPSARRRALRARVRFAVEADADDAPAGPTPNRDRAAASIDRAQGPTT